MQAAVEQVKLFCFVSDVDLDSMAGVEPTKAVVDASTMVGLLPTTQAWLAYCFEITMLRLTTGGTKGVRPVVFVLSSTLSSFCNRSLRCAPVR